MERHLGLLAKCAKGGEKIGPQLLSKVLRSPIFGNSHILNANGLHLGINRISEGEALVMTSYYSKVHDLWDAQTQSWKDYPPCKYLSYHPTKIANMDIIISKFPWNPRATNIYFKPRRNNPI
jgi:hypothetical protein